MSHKNTRGLKIRNIYVKILKVFKEVFLTESGFQKKHVILGPGKSIDLFKISKRKPFNAVIHIHFSAAPSEVILVNFYANIGYGEVLSDSFLIDFSKLEGSRLLSYELNRVFALRTEVKHKFGEGTEIFALIGWSS